MFPCSLCCFICLEQADGLGLDDRKGKCSGVEKGPIGIVNGSTDGHKGETCIVGLRNRSVINKLQHY